MASERLQKLIAPDAGRVLRRFPFAVLAAAMVAGRALLPDGLNVAWDDLSTPWTFGWSVVFMSSVAIAIWTESLSRRDGVPLQAVSLALGAAAWLGHQTPWLSPLWTLVTLAALILSAPAPDRDEQALWSFDVRVVALLVFAVLATATVALGLTSILSAVEYLFDVEFGHRANERVLVVCFWFLLPVYWCALIPARSDQALLPDDLLHKATVTLGALLALVIGILAALLHVYAARIALGGGMPKGQVGWIVSVALSAGLLGWLLCAGEGGPAAGLRRVFRRWWFAMTVVPTLLLAVAIWRRVEAYGVTPDRYAIVAAAVASAGFLALWLFRMRPPTIRSVLLIGAAVSLLGAVGPVNMPTIVAASQIERLKTILAGQGLLQDGRVTAQIPQEKWRNAQANEVAGILSVLDDVSAQNRLGAIIPADKAATRLAAEQFLGAEFRGAGGSDWPTLELPRRGGSIPVGAGELIGPFQLYAPRNDSAAQPPEDSTTVDGRKVKLEPRRLVVTAGDAETVFDLAPFAAVFDNQAARPAGLSSTDGRSTLRIDLARLRKTPDGVEVEFLSGSAVIGAP